MSIFQSRLGDHTNIETPFNQITSAMQSVKTFAGFLKSTSEELEALAEALVEIAKLAQAKRSASRTKPSKPAIQSKANKPTKSRMPSRTTATDRLLTIEQIKSELCLSERQVATLQQYWGFPLAEHLSPVASFDRQSVEEWVRWQPNPKNLAAVLRLRGARKARSPDSQSV